MRIKVRRNIENIIKSRGHLSRKQVVYGTGCGRHLIVENDFFLQGVKIHILDFTKQKRDCKFLNSFKNLSTGI
jgi:hypothetical protein